jgi:voltage-gated potassium channel
MYIGINVCLLIPLTAASYIEADLMIPFILFLPVCIYLLYKFLVDIPGSLDSILKLLSCSLLMLSIVLLTYSNLYLSIYKQYGHSAFSGPNLTADDFIYYSVTTFTTTGYGDITSTCSLSYAAAASEMLLGFLSSTIFMAILAAKIARKFNK